jgi:hypothetical protein
MDRNTLLLLAQAGEGQRWEDEERGNYDAEQLRAEFRRHLYGADSAPAEIKAGASDAASADARSGLSE